MKEERDAVFRRKYDFWPSFYQHSLFAKEVKINYFENQLSSKICTYVHVSIFMFT
jgi:hypothetical protein